MADKFIDGPMISSIAPGELSKLLSLIDADPLEAEPIVFSHVCLLSSFFTVQSALGIDPFSKPS